GLSHPTSRRRARSRRSDRPRPQSAPCRDRRRASPGVRVLHSPINIAGGPGAISQGLRELGVESTLLVFNERPFERGFDVNLQLRDTSRLSSIPFNLPTQLSAFVWAVPRFDVFHFHAGLTLLPRKLNLPSLRLLRKSIVFQ